MPNRGARRAKTESLLKNRIKTGAVTGFGLNKAFKLQPHRLVKNKVKFTSQRSSLRFIKQKANRAARRNVKLALIAGKEPLPKFGPNSARYDYW